MQAKALDVKIDDTVPTASFRRASWKLLQLKLDPLALPRQLPAPLP